MEASPEIAIVRSEKRENQPEGIGPVIFKGTPLQQTESLLLFWMRPAAAQDASIESVPQVRVTEAARKQKLT
jgi:hypothetical protein